MPKQEENYGLNKLDLIRSGTEETQFDSSAGDYIRLTLYRSDTDIFVDRFYSNQNTISGEEQVETYSAGGFVGVKPNEILETNFVAGGNYRLQFDFLRNVFDNWSNSWETPKFVITEISPSRKEIRLLAKNFIDDGMGGPDSITSEDITFDTDFVDSFNSLLAPGGTDGYTYNWVVTFDRDKNIIINNFTFDTISGDKTSLILRLDTPLPIEYKKLYKINVEKEIINTQVQDILYVSNISSTDLGASLTPDESVWTNNVSYSNDNQQNYEDLIVTASFTENTLDAINNNTNDIDVNLNVDYSKFENHVVFGSAVSKLENFKTKVGKIQNHLNVISQSLINENLSNTSYIQQRRIKAFSEMEKIKKTFTPYEKFLYFDGQSESTASAPGLGLNYAHSIPVTSNGDLNYKLLSNHNGFKTVHRSQAENSQFVDLFSNQYHIEDIPFYNYTGSLYLSFLMKADPIKNGSGIVNKFSGPNNRNHLDGTTKVPEGTFHTEDILRPDVTGSAYRRFIMMVSQSHWRPTGSTIAADGVYEVNKIIEDSNGTNYFSNSGKNTYWEILNTDSDVTSANNSASSYPIRLDNTYVPLGTNLTGSNIAFTGSILPSGELFNTYWSNPNFADTTSATATSSYTTDIKITLKNPLDTKPFSFIYPTGSNQFDDWYNTMYTEAESFDEDNIHSLNKNVPEKIATGDEVKTFLNVWGEHFDGVRNYIDTYKTFYNRSYTPSNSVPTNLLPILGDNLGWELINPFSSSIQDYFSSITGSADVGKKITENTWRKIINNLVYVYKSKGTQNSLDALLNIYGYPSDLINVNEYGGSIVGQNPTYVDDTYTTFSGFNNLSNKVSYIQEKQLHTMMDYSVNSNPLKIDYQQNDASGSVIEFNMIPNTTATTMSIIEASGSQVGETRWHLHYEPFPGNTNRGRLVTRINHGQQYTSSIYFNDGINNAFSCSTDYFDIGNDRMFNVHFSLNGGVNVNGPNIYVLSKNELGEIDLFTTASFDLTEILSTHVPPYTVTDGVFVSNSASTGSTLYFGKSFNGKISDIRLWKNELSASKMKQHTLNPNSIVGNNLNSMETELVYRYRLNESPKSGSNDTSIKDANSDNFGDFSKNTDIVNSYTTKLIDTYKFTPRVDGISQKNSNMITTDVDRILVKNLSPIERSYLNTDDQRLEQQVLGVKSNKVDLSSSPTDIINEHITQVLADKDITQFYSKWSDLYEPYYKDLDDLRDKILKGVSVDINTYINTQAQLYNPFILEAISSILPLHSDIESGVVLKPNFLERNKIEYKKSDLINVPYYDLTLEKYIDINDIDYLDPYTLSLDKTTPNLISSYLNNPESIITQEEMFNYSMEHLNIFKFDTFTQTDLFQYNIDYINPIDFSVLNMIDEEIGISVNYITPTEMNLGKIYNEIIKFNFEYSDILQSNIIDIYKDIITYSIIYSKIFDFELDKTYENNISYIMEMSNNFDFNLNEFTYRELGMSYLKQMTDSISIFSEEKFNVEFKNINESNILEWPYKSIGINTVNILKGNMERWPYLSFNSEIEETPLAILDEHQYRSLNVDYLNIYSDSLEEWPYEQFSISNTSIVEETIEPWPSKLNMEYQNTMEDVNTEIQDSTWRYRKESPLKNWGRTIDDTWIMNLHQPGDDGTANTGYYDDYYTSFAIMDHEYPSGSRKYVSCGEGYSEEGELNCLSEEYCDSMDWTCHRGRTIFHEPHRKILNDEYPNMGNDTPENRAPVKGRVIGKTTYLPTGSNGELIYPSNHYHNYHTSKDQLRYLMYEKNVEFVDAIDFSGNSTRKKQGLGHFSHKADLFPFENVVRLNVEGSDTENVLIVEKTTDRPGNIDKDTTDNNDNPFRGPEYGEPDPPPSKL